MARVALKKARTRGFSDSAVSFPARLLLVLLVYVAGSVLAIRAQFLRGLTTHIKRQKEMVFSNFNVADLKRCETVKESGFWTWAIRTCAALCREARTLAMMRQQHAQDFRDAHVFSRDFSEWFDSMRGVSLNSNANDIMKTKTCLQAIKQVDKSNRTVDDICIFILVVSIVLLFYFVEVAFTILFQTLLSVWAIEQMPLSAAIGAVIATVFPCEVRLFLNFVDGRTPDLPMKYKLWPALFFAYLWIRMPSWWGAMLDITIACVQICLTGLAIIDAADMVLKEKHRHEVSEEHHAKDPQCSRAEQVRLVEASATNASSLVNRRGCADLFFSQQDSSSSGLRPRSSTPRPTERAANQTSAGR